MSYASTQEHLLAELQRVDTMLDAYKPTEFADVPADRESTATADRLIGEPAALELAVPAERRQEIEELTTEIRKHCRATGDETRLRLGVLAETCGLSRRHLDVLMLAMAPELDETYEPRFQRAHDHQSLSRPTPRLIETLFGRTQHERIAVGTLISSDSPLRQHDLIDLQSPPNTTLSKHSRLITVSDRIVDYLKGYDSIDPDLDALLANHARSSRRGLIDCEATASLSMLPIEDALLDRLTSLSKNDCHRCYWYGPSSEKHRAVEAVCQSNRLLRADLQAVLEAGALEWLRREAALLGRPLHLYNATAATETPETNTSLDAVFEAFADLDIGLCITGRESWTPTESVPTQIDAIIEFPYPSVELRREFWTAHAADLPEDVDPSVLAGTFRLTHSQLNAALSTARSLAEGEALTADDIYTGCSAQSADGLGELAERIEPDSRWDELQLRPETEQKLQLVRTHITQQSTIDNDWGFADGSARGSGVVALFEGPSGTGKTMAAELLAGDVGMDLYRIDLSSVVSKYIGETEENLEEIFEAATNSNAILLFDEADAVFGGRTEVSDSTDRYANAEVNYLLQRIERYDGIVLLTTNYASQIDSAFERRLDHMVSFKQPQQPTRTAIWEGIFPDDAPVGAVDYEFLSTFEFTGGQIDTIAHTAAILAADEQSTAKAAKTAEPTIEMRHLVRAIQLEFETSGRMVDPTEYEPYRHLLSDGELTMGHEAGTGVGDRQVAAAAEDDQPQSLSADNQSSDRTPEAIMRTFFDRLDSGDSAVHELYHSRAVVDPVSRKELRRAKTVDCGIEGEIHRESEASDRVVLSFTRQRGDTEATMSAELRPDDGGWRLFNLEGRTANRPGDHQNTSNK